MSKPKKKPKHCSYCGKLAPNWEREHVIPRAIYPLFKRHSKVQRIIVPACPKCNDRWVDDEVEFRNMLVMCGDVPNGARSELFISIRRSFYKEDGKKRLFNIASRLEPVLTPTGIRFKIFPVENVSVMNVVRKIVRGLCAYEDYPHPISDNRVRAALFTAKPPMFLEELNHNPYESGVFEYWHSNECEGVAQSVWFLRFFETLLFVAFVSNEGGFPVGWKFPEGCTTGRTNVTPPRNQFLINMKAAGIKFPERPNTAVDPMPPETFLHKPNPNPSE